MSETAETERKPLAKPPGYREPGAHVEKPPLPFRKPDLPPSFYADDENKSSCGCRNCCSRFWCCFIVFTVLLTLLFISAGGFLYLWFDPRVPNVGLKSFQVEKFNVSGGPRGQELNSRVVISVQFKNSNDNIKFVYDKMAMALKGKGLNGGLNLGQQTVPGFTQGNNNATAVKFIMKGNQKVKNDQEAKKLMEQFRAKSLMITVELTTGFGVEFNGLNTGTVGVKVVCGASTLKDINNGAMPPCKVFVLNRAFM